MSLAPGTRLGDYDILAPLGAGSMGEVYRSHDPRLNRDVAIKVLDASASGHYSGVGLYGLESRRTTERSTDVTPVVNAVVAAALRFCGATDAVITLRRAANIVFVAHAGEVDAEVGTERPMERESTMGRAISDGHPAMARTNVEPGRASTSERTWSPVRETSSRCAAAPFTVTKGIHLP